MIKEVDPIMLCPNCGGTGQVYSNTHHTLVECDMCWGKCIIPAVSCRGCGRPATRWWPPLQRPIVRYCGLETCLNALVTLHKPVGGGIIPKGIVAVVKEITKANSRERVNQMEELRQDLVRREIGPHFKGSCFEGM